MGKIHVHKEGHHHQADRLECENLKDGDKINVTWPDGSKEVVPVKVFVRKCEKSVSREAYFVSKYHGRDSWLRLLGLEAEFVPGA